MTVGLVTNNWSKEKPLIFYIGELHQTLNFTSTKTRNRSCNFGKMTDLVVQHNSAKAWMLQLLMPIVFKAMRTQARPQSQECSWLMCGTYVHQDNLRTQNKKTSQGTLY